MLCKPLRGQTFLRLLFLAGLFFIPSACLAEQQTISYFEVSSAPQGADVLVDGTFAGETPVIVPVQSMNGNGSVIRVMKEGFQIWEQRYPQNPQSGNISKVMASLVPVSPFGSLQVSSKPSGALVTINNGNGQMAPWMYQNLPTGTYLVSFFLMGFDPFIRTVVVQPGQTTQVVANMTQRTGSGTVQISSEPGGATVYIDGVYVGITNLVAGHISPGRHQVKVTRSGYEDYVEWVVVQDKGNVLVKATFKPATAASGGFVVVTSEPPGGSVFLDSVFKGITETGRPLEITNVSPGMHLVYISSKNYQDYQAQIQVSAGAITPVSISMNPSPMPQDSGLIIMTSDPAGADIMLDGKLQGQTPATMESVSSGTHQYSFSLDGYQEYRSQAEMIPGQVLQVHAALSPLAGPSGTSGQKTPLPAFVLIAGLVLGYGLISRKR
jgi:hypothetical protein